MGIRSGCKPGISAETSTSARLFHDSVDGHHHTASMTVNGSSTITPPQAINVSRASAPKADGQAQQQQRCWATAAACQAGEY
ncbi:MAG: hypothetical protein HC767_14550 [Akkermansiaceae bacterium]|nr:hypothetical protein [Akkermansiaceae bacterium]